MNLIHAVNDMPLRKKIIILFALIGIVPLIITFFISYGEIRKLVVNGQNYAENQSYEQTLTTLNRKLEHIEELSSMLIVNKDMEAILAKGSARMSVADQIEVYGNIVDYTQIMVSSSDIDSIVYFVDDNYAFTGVDTLFRRMNSIRQLDWAQKVIENKGGPTWTLNKDIDTRTGQSYLSLNKLLWNPEDYTSAIGIVSLNLELKQIQQSLTKSNPEQLVYVETAAGELVAGSGGKELETMRLDKPFDSKGSYVNVSLASGSYMARGQEIGDTNLYLMSVISHRAATKSINEIKYQMGMVYVIICLLLLLFIFPVARSITRRIYLLMNKMSQVRQGRLNELDIRTSKDEVGQLILSYNYMINSVQELMVEQYKLGQEKTQAELKALQSQINPHFLYNTLDMLNWMAQKEERDNIQQIIYALSDYYKLILNKGNDFVTVRDELRLSSIYMEIQKKRFKNRVQLEMEVEESVMDCMLPKITIQPLVENAILHGVSEKPGGRGTIRITGHIEGERLIMRISDDGVGMPEEGGGGQRKHRGSGYGLSNIRKRLDLYFGQTAELQLQSTPGEGTDVTINVPVTHR
ncbi:sensor histidine kinase [Paenibacillus sp. BK720]|uniref:cache domain-containing sensor histidine kinase n=1 Tax=Paenibacillus sp. BK720 TaxID=2587092 RepID=UPI0014220FCA|nr:sensor histidine kinase [Paenibacillus sp. BK720]NIK68209.1 two-component system sensor histidine kinase YesM [Paenibacillus sp. BK720]